MRVAIFVCTYFPGPISPFTSKKAELNKWRTFTYTFLVPMQSLWGYVKELLFRGNQRRGDPPATLRGDACAMNDASWGDVRWVGFFIAGLWGVFGSFTCLGKGEVVVSIGFWWKSVDWAPGMDALRGGLWFPGFRNLYWIRRPSQCMWRYTYPSE